ncbi:hypothetical protein EMPG_14002 [Blastomyces silverae]|uniref:Uncharacterized protein n=1 Tax=Blastomyces silverae TaxID=2060906 RepID=A0A0H1BHV6_9EURO|nr:hypothetical protein EMPG_14002 [Blastomyces silverae]
MDHKKLPLATELSGSRCFSRPLIPRRAGLPDNHPPSSDEEIGREELCVNGHGLHRAPLMRYRGERLSQYPHYIPLCHPHMEASWLAFVHHVEVIR